MASTYSQLKIELIGTGDQAGTWGNTTNTNLGTAIEEAITGSANVTFASSNVALALTDTNATQTARNLRLNLTGTIAAAQHLFLPAIEKQYIVDNSLTFPVTIANGSNSGATGNTITIPAGLSAIVFNDGVNIDNPVSYTPLLGNVTINGGTANALTLTNTTYVSLTSNAAVLTNVSITNGNINAVSSNASTFSNVSIISGNINSVTSNASTFSNVTIRGGTANALTLTNATYVSITSNAAVLTNVSITNGNINAVSSNASTFSNVSIISGNINSVTSNASTFTNATISSVTTPITVSQGGTSLANLTLGSVLVGNNTGTVTLVAPGTANNVLTSDGTQWISQAPTAAASSTSIGLVRAISINCILP